MVIVLIQMTQNMNYRGLLTLEKLESYVKSMLCIVMFVIVVFLLCKKVQRIVITKGLGALQILSINISCCTK